MYEHSEINTLITLHQFGFRRNGSTQQCLLNLTNTIRMNADQGMCTSALYMNSRKAFGTANYSCIIKKIPDFGKPNTELEWLTYYLFHRKQQAKIDGHVSDAQSITCGVPQGSILGPWLFLLLINDLLSTVKPFQIVLYSDNAVLYYAHQLKRYLNQNGHLTPNKYYWINHNINTSGNKSLFCLPKFKAKMLRKSVHNQGAAIFNKLPRELREELSIVNFKIN